MKTRLAWCGHEYTVPNEFFAGRRRKQCDECLSRNTGMSPELRGRMIVGRVDRATAAALRSHDQFARRLAACGHAVPYHPGHTRRRCNQCTPTSTARRPPDPRGCEQCGEVFAPAHHAQRFCSISCSSRKHAPTCTTRGCSKPHRAKGLCSGCYNAVRLAAGKPKHALPTTPCPTCGSLSVRSRGSGQTYCSLLCRSGGAFKGAYTDAQRSASREKQRRRRAQKRAAVAEKFTDIEIYERDGWRCGVCRRAVNRRLAWPHPMSASLDHIIPISEEGSSHTRANVRLAHLGCNVARGNRGGNEQLLLIG